MRSAVIIAVGLIAAGAIAYGIAAVWDRPLGIGSPESAPAARPAPDFALKDYSGAIITLSQFRGRPVVVNSWASWCPFCREELVDLAAVQREFGDRVAIIAIDRAEPIATAQRYSDELGVSDDLIFLLDPSDSFYQSIGGFSMPETIFVDADGRIVFHKRGPMDRAEIRQRIEKILNPKPETLDKSQ